MKTVLVGTDGNPRADKAVELAAELAEATGSTLHLVAACSAPVVGASPEMVAPPDVTALVAGLQTELDAVAARLRSDSLKIETHVSAGAASEVLCRVAEAIDADLVVVGNHRMHGAARILGSVANRVAHHAPCSVLIADTA